MGERQKELIFGGRGRSSWNSLQKALEKKCSRNLCGAPFDVMNSNFCMLKMKRPETRQRATLWKEELSGSPKLKNCRSSYRAEALVELTPARA